MYTSCAHDLSIFSTAEDIPQLLIETNSTQFDTLVEYHSQRAALVSDATAQVMLASLEETDSAQQGIFQEKAEQIAYNLGYQECVCLDIVGRPGDDITNPFSNQYLQLAWDNGFTQSTVDNKNNCKLSLENQLWNNTINPESFHTQYLLAALTLFHIAEQADNTSTKHRATQLAHEMASYSDNNQPTPQRQDQIDRFLSQQTSRLAAELEL